MSTTIVVKFGGTSLGTSARIRRAAQRLKAYQAEGRVPVAVVSARGCTTDRLMRQFRTVSGDVDSARELDRALATGETLSAALLAAALQAIGVRAASLDAVDAGIEAEGCFGNATPVRLTGDRIVRLLDAGVIPVVAGFQGVRADGERVTLGRGGSDTSAVFLAASIGAACHIVTDVDGVYTDDPRTAPAATRFEALSHDALEALTRAGAVVVHPAAARIARLHSVRLLIHHYDALTPAASGTWVGGAA